MALYPTNIKVEWFKRFNAITQTVILVKLLDILKLEQMSTFQSV